MDKIMLITNDLKMKKGQIGSYSKQSTISCFYKLFLEQQKILSQNNLNSASEYNSCVV